ncbi:helix-turn-helix domain-containing protein [Mastigocladopsis repens]|uniref:helix-turn-helix domain-containing protein n=1 Tax=Mastigocladopsis repens TaxID=221287 RepID=UPI0002FE6667|nr:helix-turn-helix domain-containing protein [Mastigocladopsis repens]
MATTSLFLLKILENSTIEISQDELRTLLGEIEAELHRSKVYRRAMAMLQNLLGSSEQANILFKAVGREAIGLAFRQFVQQYQKTEQNQLQEDSASKTPPDDLSHDVSQSLTSVKEDQKTTIETDSQANLPSESQVESHTANDSIKVKEDSPKTKTSIGWRNPSRKRRQVELAKQIAAEQRVETLRQIGQQLRQVRESQGLSLSQLHVYTHVPLRHMEAVENGNWELLPEDVYVRGFIRVMANALGLNGTNIAASLPAPEPVTAILPSCYQYKSRFGFGIGLRPVHLYVGYAALVAGSVGGLSIMSSQQANADRLMNTDAATPASSSFTESLQETKPTSKPGLSSSANVTVGPDIAPPEAL